MIRDITDEVRHAKAMVIHGGNTPGDCWQDYIDWKNLQSMGVDKIVINGQTYSYSKWGPENYKEQP